MGGRNSGRTSALSPEKVAELQIKGFPRPGYKVDEVAPQKVAKTHTCGRCGLKKGGANHSSESPFCTVLESNWAQGHIQRGMWDAEEKEKEQRWARGSKRRRMR
jgi:hypothetical protein